MASGYLANRNLKVADLKEHMLGFFHVQMGNNNLLVKKNMAPSAFLNSSENLQIFVEIDVNKKTQIKFMLSKGDFRYFPN